MNVTKLIRTHLTALLSAGLLALAASPLTAQTCRLLSPQLTMSPNTQSFTVGDLNGDGKADIAAVVGGNLEIYLSNGAAFAPPVVVTAELSAVFIGDVNNDGLLDIVAFGADALTAVVYLNHGGGRFGPSDRYPIGLDPSGLAIGDLNGDGFPDLAITLHGISAQDNGKLAVLFNNGDGSFGPPQLYSVGVNPNGVVIADFNKDGHNDVAVINYGSAFNNVSSVPGSAMIFAGSATGVLSLSQTISLGPQASVATVGDFNGDGYLDLAITVINGDDSAAGVFSVLWNNHGTFSPATNYPTGASPGGISVGDFNQDGYLDLVVTNTASFVDEVVVYLNDGNGHFVASQKLYDPDGPATTAVGDFNGDGKLDVAVYNPYGANISVFYNQVTSPTINLSSSANPSDTGVPVTLTAAVSVPTSSACTMAGGTVTFLDSGNVIQAAVSLNSQNEAVVTDSNLTTGTHTLRARFKPAALSLVGRGTSNAVSQVVQ